MDPVASPSLIPTHTVADWLLRTIDSILDFLGLARHQTVEEVIYVAVVIVIAFAIGWVAKRVVYWIVSKIVALRPGRIGQELLHWHTMEKVSSLLPPLIMMALVPFAFESTHGLRSWILRIVGVYAMVMFGVAGSAIFDFIYNHYNENDNKRKTPLKGLLSIAKGLLWIVIVICAVSTLVDKSPAYLLTGLGAFAAALMLIFKDSIQGFVAGIQMGQNDMIHVGDWIVVPNTPANGVVLDMTLSAVKVQNFDNTIVTVPPYTLISTSFQNYRGMAQSGARRIMKNFTIDVTTVRSLTENEAQAMAAPYPRLKDFVAKLLAQGRTAQNDGGLTPINGSLETNLGLFRAYVSLYVYYNPGITTEQQLLIRVLDPTNAGLPLQVYCFTNTTDWDKYEAIQSDIIEHVTVMAPRFGLAIYTSGAVSVDLTETAPAGPEAQPTDKVTKDIGAKAAPTDQSANS